MLDPSSSPSASAILSGPALPTAAEDVPGFSAMGWLVLMAPRGSLKPS
jgi:hypothetical protein